MFFVVTHSKSWHCYEKKLLEVQTFVNYNIPYVLLCPCLLHLHCDLNAEKSDTKWVLI